MKSKKMTSAIASRLIKQNSVSSIAEYSEFDRSSHEILRNLELPAEVHCSSRNRISAEKLRKIQIKPKKAVRPISIIQENKSILDRILNETLPTYMDDIHSQYGLMAEILHENLWVFLQRPPTACLSYHFPMPLALSKKFESFTDYAERQAAIASWAKESLGALSSQIIDVENITEGCGVAVEFSKKIFPNRFVLHEELDDAALQVRFIGSECSVIYFSFEKVVSSCRWSTPQHEISDLFNRALPPELTMLYLDEGAGGVYVLTETENFEKRLLSVL